MSIPIPARRYISEIGLSDRKWKKDNRAIFDGVNGFLIIKTPDDFQIISAVFDGISWISWNPEIGFYSNENIVCWSEIKI